MSASVHICFLSISLHWFIHSLSGLVCICLSFVTKIWNDLKYCVLFGGLIFNEQNSRHKLKMATKWETILFNWLIYLTTKHTSQFLLKPTEANHRRTFRVLKINKSVKTTTKIHSECLMSFCFKAGNKRKIKSNRFLYMVFTQPRGIEILGMDEWIGFCDL